MKIVISILLVFWALTVGGQSCEIDGISYYNFQDIVQIFDAQNCDRCHSPTGEAPGWQYKNYEDIISIDACGNEIIVHGNASISSLYDKLNQGQAACGVRMPVDRPPLSQQEIYAVESWINNGATEACIPLYEDVKLALEQANCSTCHTASSTWSTHSYEHLSGSQNASLCNDIIVAPFMANESLLFQLVSGIGTNCNIDQQHSRLPDKTVRTVRDWINAGALKGVASLPVELEKFALELRNRDQEVLLSWISTLEIGTDKYVLERSTDGRNFSTIAEVPAIGSNTQAETYYFSDKDHFLGLAYYRLRIMDYDGSFSYSHIISVRKEPNTDVLALTPNLIMGSEILNVSWYSRIERPTAYAYIVNAAGQSIKKIEISEGENQIPLPSLGDGLYYIVIHNFFDSYQLGRFIVVN